MVDQKKAFPNVTGQTGMDLRDYFAAQAMQGLLSANPDFEDDDAIGAISNAAYQLADAMMEARNK